MIPNSSTRLIEPIRSAANSTREVYATKAINLGEPLGPFSLGIPADKIAGDPHYLDATEDRASRAASKADRKMVDFSTGRLRYPIVGEPGYVVNQKNNGFFNVTLFKDNKKVGFAHPSAVFDPLFVKNNDGTFEPIAYMVFKVELIAHVLQMVPMGYRLEDQSYKSQVDDADLYQGPTDTDSLSRRDDGNWVVTKVSGSPSWTGLRHRRKAAMEAVNPSQDLERTRREGHSASEEPGGHDADPSDTSSSQLRTTIIGKFTFNYENGGDEEENIDSIDSGIQSESESDSEIQSDSENADTVGDLGTGSLTLSSQPTPSAVRTELLQGGIPGRGMWTMGSMAVLLYVGILAKLSYDLHNRPASPPQYNPDFESTVFNAFQRCAIEIGFEPTAGDKGDIASYVSILKDCFGKQLGAINNIGELLQCRPDELGNNINAIYGGFDDQMRAMTSTAGLLLPNACLIVLSLVFLLTYGAI